MLHVYTGNGKGKTTIAIGLAMRARGTNLRVAWVAFDKGGIDDMYSERTLLRDMGVAFYATGMSRITRDGKFRFSITKEDKQQGAYALEQIDTLVRSDEYDMLTLDEICPSLHLGIVQERDVQKCLEGISSEKEIICTGRYAPDWLIDTADLVTELKEVKHYFTQGHDAKKGRDY